MKLYAIDIETDTTIDGLDPTIAEVVTMALWSDDLQAVIEGGTERSRLTELSRLLAFLEPGIVLTWNGQVFDLPFLATRARVTGVCLGLELTRDPQIVPKYDFTPGHACGYRARLGRHAHADLAYACKDYADRTGVTWSLKPVCESLGIPMVKVNAAAIHLLSSAALVEFNLSGVHGTHLLGTRLGPNLDDWIDALPRVDLWA